MSRHVEGVNELYQPYENIWWRTGRRVGQCVHAQVNEEPSEDDVLLFEAPSPRIAQFIVTLHNEMIADLVEEQINANLS